MHFRVSTILALAVCCATSFTVGRLSLNTDSASSSELSGVGSKFAAADASGDNRRLGPRSKGQRPTRPSYKKSHNNSSIAGEGSNASSFTRTDLILKNVNLLDRTEQWFEFVKNLDSTQMDAVATHMQNNEFDVKFSREYKMLLSAWAKANPHAALEHAKQSKNAYGAVIVSWAANDPDAAVRWANEDSSGNRKASGMALVITGVAARDLQRATKLAEQLSDPDERARAVIGLSGYYVEQGTAAALDWAMNMKDERCRNQAILSMTTALSKADPKSAAEILLAYPAGKENQYTDQLIREMTQMDLEAAVGYLNKVNDQGAKSRAMHSIILRLSHSNPKATISIMDSNPDLVSDDMVSYLAGNASLKEPGFSISIIPRIKDAALRERAYKGAISSWIRKDADSAIKWMNQNELAPDLRRWADERIQRMQDAKSKNPKKQ